jgi:hypothetical protein
MRKIRPFGWVIIAFNIYYLVQFSIGLSELSDSALSAGVYMFLALSFWAVLNVILYVIYKVTARNKRRCPACDSPVKTGLTVCPKCNFDFMKAAAGQ